MVSTYNSSVIEKQSLSKPSGPDTENIPKPLAGWPENLDCGAFRRVEADKTIGG